jgi:hypothetical protein
LYDRDAEVVDTGIHEPIRQIVEEALLKIDEVGKVN